MGAAGVMLLAFGSGAACGNTPLSPLPLAALMHNSDIVVSGTMRFDPVSGNDGTTRVHAHIPAPDVIVTHMPALRPRDIDLGVRVLAPIESSSVKQAYGIYFLVKAGSTFALTDISTPRILASPPRYRLPPRQRDPRAEIAAQVTSVLAIPPDLVIQPSLGIDLGPGLTGPFGMRPPFVMERFLRHEVNSTDSERALAVYREVYHSLLQFDHGITHSMGQAAYRRVKAGPGHIMALTTLLSGGDMTQATHYMPELLRTDSDNADAYGDIAAQIAWSRTVTIPDLVQLCGSDNAPIHFSAQDRLARSIFGRAIPILHKALISVDRDARQTAVDVICDQTRGCEMARRDPEARAQKAAKLLADIKAQCSAPRPTVPIH